MNLEQLQQLVRVQGELATIEALHRENEHYRGTLRAIARYVDEERVPQVEWILDRIEEAFDAVTTSATKRSR